MQKASGPAEAAMGKLGTSSKELGRLLTTEGLDVALAKINEGMNKVGTDAEKNAILMEIFGTENAAAAGIMLQNTDKFAAFSKGIEEGMQGQGAAFEQAGIRMNTAGEMINRVQAYVSDAFIGITQSIGQGATALVGASAQFAPLITSFAGLSTLIPEDGIASLKRYGTAMTETIGSMKNFGIAIVNSVVPGLISHDVATKSIVLNTNALSLANVKNIALSKLKVASDYLQTTAVYALITGQTSLNAVMMANPMMSVIAGAVALGGALYLLYDNVESVRNVFDAAWSVISVGAETAWEAIKAGASVVGEIGSMVYEFITIPFNLAWSVISGIGGAIGSLVGSLLGVSGAGLTLQTVFTGIQQAGQVAIDIFNTVKATIAGITGAVGAFTDSIAEGIGKVFSLDLGGAWDSFTGAGDKAAQAFNDKFNDKMRTAKFDEAAKNVTKGLEQAGNIEVKVKAKTDFQDMITSYESAQAKIDALNKKKSISGELSKEDKKQLEYFTAEAFKANNEIAKIAPNAVKGIKEVTVQNGVLQNTYDLNISKAREFGMANDYTQQIENQKKVVSKSITEMTTNYASQEDVVKKMKKELEKPITNKEEYAKLQTSFTEASKKAEEMKTQLIDNFTKAGAAGMLTDDAIKGVAKSLKTTEQEAKKMLLVAELKKLKDSGLETEEAIARIGDKYGYTKDEAKKVANESANQTKNVKETKEEVKNLADAWDSVVNSIKGASESSKKQFVSAASYLELMKKNPVLAKEMYDGASAEAKAMFDMLMKMGDAEAKEYIANGLAKAKADKQNAEQVDKIVEQKKELIDGKKKETSESKKATAEAKSQYEIDKESLATLKETQKREEDGFVSKQERNRKEQGFIETENSKLNDKIAKNQRVLDDYKAQQEVLDKMLIDANELSDKDGKRTQAVNDTKKAMAELNADIEKVGNDNASIQVDIKINDAEQKKAFEKLKLEAQNLELEGKVKLGLISETQKVKIEIDKIELDKAGINEAIQKVESELSKDTDNQELKNKIQIYKNELLKLNNDLDVKNAEYSDKTSRDRISSIADTVTRERELKIYELKKTYDEEIYLAQDNAQKKLVISQAYADNRNKIEQDYLAKTSFSYNALTKLSTAFANIKVGSVDRNEIVNLNKTKSDLAKERKELENSYAVGKTDYESYQKSLSDIQNKESENRIAIEQAEAERRKAIWSGFTTAISGYFGTMYDEYSKKASESVNAVIQSQDTEYRIKQEKALANSALQASIENNNYLMQATMKAKLTELDNQDLANKTANSEAISALYTNLSVSAGSMFAQMMADNESFGKSILKTAFAVAKAIVPVLTIQILGKEFVEKGPIGAITAAAMTATLYGAIALAESAVSGAFKNGVVNFQGKGNGTSDSNLVRISHGESVMTAKATANPINQKFFTYANKGGDLVSFLQTDKDIQRQLAQQRIMQSYDSVSRQKEMFDRIVADYNNTNKQLKEQNRELVNEIRTMKNELVEVFKNKVLIESKQAINVNATNNVINKIEPATLFGRK